MALRELSSPPSMPALYGRALVQAALAALPGPGGPSGEEPSDLELGLAGVRVDRDRLADYDRVCAFRVDDRLPMTYPHLLAFPLSLALMTDPAFPFPAMGLVHVANRIAQRRALRADEAFDLRVRAGAVTPAPRGLRFELHTEARVDGTVVWSERSAYLRRQGAASASAESPRRPAADPAPRVAVWRAPADTGRRYARVSGDINPIHLHPLSARLLGFPAAIAHGMWVAARCLAAFEGRLPDGGVLDVRFQRPLVLPGRIAFSATQDDGVWRFAARDARRGAPHLTGTLAAS